MTDLAKDGAPSVSGVVAAPAVNSVASKPAAAPAAQTAPAVAAKPEVPAAPAVKAEEKAPQLALKVEPVAPASTPKSAAAKPEASVAKTQPAPRGRPRKVADAAKVNAAKAVITRKSTARKAPAARVTQSTMAEVKASAPKKETVKMATKTKTPEFAASIQESLKDASEKAKAALEKSQAAFGDAGEFAKGNLEAVVESSKILANGMKSMSEAYVAETRSAYETMTADFKELAAVKSPTEFLELQSKLMRKNFDAAVATGSKKSEAMLKLAGEAFQPLSTRLSLAMEKFKRAA